MTDLQADPGVTGATGSAEPRPFDPAEHELHLQLLEGEHLERERTRCGRAHTPHAGPHRSPIRCSRERGHDGPCS